MQNIPSKLGATNKLRDPCRLCIDLQIREVVIWVPGLTMVSKSIQRSVTKQGSACIVLAAVSLQVATLLCSGWYRLAGPDNLSL